MFVCSMMLLAAPIAGEAAVTDGGTEPTGADSTSAISSVGAVSANEGATTAAAAHTVTIRVNGATVSFPDAKPFVNDDGRTMVPVRFVSEQLGAEVKWNDATQMADIQYRGRKISIPLDQPVAYIDGRKASLDTSAVRRDDRVMVPLALISAVYGVNTDWNGDTNTVTLQAIPEKTVVARNKMYPQAPPMTIDVKKEYSAVVTTNFGDITIKLHPQDAPQTVNNFIYLARQHYYEGIRFHRIMKDFMIQTGDPLGNGTGGPGYQFADELPAKIPYAPGVVAMANAGPNTNGSQFFICTGDEAKGLNSHPNYTVFGEVASGMDVVKRIAAVPVVKGQGNEVSSPLFDVIIYGVSVEEK